MSGIFAPVGWVERSDTHHRVRLAVMGIAALNPSYDVGCLSRRPVGHRGRSAAPAMVCSGT